MSEETKAAEETAAAENGEAQDSGLVKTDGSGNELDYKEMGAQLEGFTEGEEMTGDYYDFEEGESSRFWVTGVAKLNAKGEQGKTINAIRLMTKDGKHVVAGDVVIRTTLEDIALNVVETRKPVPVLIECTGSTTSAAGEYKLFKIKELN